MKRMPYFLARAATAAVTLAAAVSAFGQEQPQTQTRPEPPRPDFIKLQRERTAREIDLRIVESEGRKQRSRHTDEAQPMRLDIQQILEDFKLLQVVSRNLMTIASQGDTLNLKEVGKSASEIKKRAARLSSNLVLPKSEKGGKRGPEVLFDEAELKRSVETLDALIDGFAHNPVFREVNLVDAKLSAKARRDLDEIIELSDRMRKSSEQLSKAPARREQ